MMSNNKKTVLLGLTSACVLAVAGVWAAGGLSVPQLTALSAKTGRRITTLTIETSDPVPYLTNRPDPLTLLVDLRQVDAAHVVNAVTRAEGVIAGVSVEQDLSADGVKLTRVRIRLTQPAAHQVRTKRNLIYVDLDSAFPLGNGGSSTSNSPAGLDLAGAAAGPKIRYATSLDAVRADSESAGASVTLTGNGELAVESVTALGDGTPRVVLEFPNIRSKTPADIVVARGPVSAVHVSTTGAVPTTHVVVDLIRPASYRVVPAEDGGKDLKIFFDDSLNDGAGSPGPAAMVSTTDPLNALMASSRTAGAPGRAPLAQQPQPQPGAPMPPVAPPLSQPATGGPSSGQRFTGSLVTLDFTDADLRSVLRTIGDDSGFNFVLDPKVDGKVDLHLTAVPWDQALDIILRSNGLAYEVDGTVVRIAPVAVFTAEKDDRKKQQEASDSAADLPTITRTLSYAKAGELVALLKSAALSPRGDVQIDPRTNTLIIRDIASKLQGVAQVLDTLDRPQPQVEIEARIIQTTRDFARNLGVQWGLNGRVSPELNNTTGLAFPNQGSLTGRTGPIQGPSQGELTDHTATMVNLGVSPATSAIGLALGSVNGALNLDVALSALESSGHGRILSTPRITTQNNVVAKIIQGVQIPIQTVANNTVTVSFKDAALTLQVTPQITASNTVIMQIDIENAAPDFSRAINNIPPIDTQHAITTILVSDGQTSVIGGIYVSQEQSTNDRTPGLHKVPLLGWLFRRDTLSDQSRELLIFITPRIVKS
jgi:type IV pilus secretin PilQ/predicted competence protein